MPRFGFDLDNTLIDYSESARIYAELNNLQNVKSISELRRVLKPSSIESNAWTQAQSWIYGDGLKYARISDDALNLLNKLNSRSWKISVYSHKTNIGPVEFGSTPFVSLMTNWIAKNELGAFFVHNKNLFFYPNLDLKVRAIGTANLDSYVDDLPKVFAHDLYPRKIRSYLYKSQHTNLSWVSSINHFSEILID